MGTNKKCITMKRKWGSKSSFLVLLFAFSSTAQAGERGRRFFRVLDRFSTTKLNETSRACSATEARHGTIEEAVYENYYSGSSSSDVAASTNKERLDSAAKSKKYGKNEYPLFQSGDGSDEDPQGIPTRYLHMQLGDRDLAYAAASATLQWREAKDLDRLLTRPRPQFDVCKRVCPHAFVGRDIAGHVVFVQRPALLNLKLAHGNGLSNADLLEHYVFVNEYLWQVIEKDNALATMTSIIDLQGLKLSILRQAELVSFMKEFVQTMDAHFPQRANKTLVVNAPKWFHVLYKIVSPLLRENTKSKIEIHARGKHQDKALRAKMKNAEAMLPASFFTKKKRKDEKKDDGDDETPEDELLLDSKLEHDLREFTLARLKEARLKMQEVIPEPV